MPFSYWFCFSVEPGLTVVSQLSDPSAETAGSAERPACGGTAGIGVQQKALRGPRTTGPWGQGMWTSTHKPVSHTACSPLGATATLTALFLSQSQAPRPPRPLASCCCPNGGAGRRRADSRRGRQGVHSLLCLPSGFLGVSRSLWAPPLPLPCTSRPGGLQYPVSLPALAGQVVQAGSERCCP